MRSKIIAVGLLAALLCPILTDGALDFLSYSRGN